MDWNVQWDTEAAEVVAAAATGLTLASLPATLKAHLRAAHLARLRASGPLGALLARQSEAHARDHGIVDLARTHSGLPDDLLNFHYDPVACAVAVGWPGGVVGELPLAYARDGDVFRWYADENGRRTRVLVDLDAESFDETWLTAVEAAQRT